MMTVQEMKEKRAHKYECAKDVIGTVERSGLAMSAEQKSAIEGYEAEGDELDAKIKALEAQEAMAQRISDKRAGLNVSEKRSAPAMSVTSMPTVHAEAKSESIFHRSGSLKAFENSSKGEKDAYQSGQFIRAICGNEKAQRYCKENGIEYRAALGEGSSSIGGALVPTPLENSILQYREQHGVVRKNARVWPMNENTLYIPKRSTSLTATYTAENAALTESEPTFSQVQLVAKKLGVLTLVSSELSEDSVISIADYVAQDIGWAFALKEDSDVFNGDGSSSAGSITGITTYVIDGSHTASVQTAAAAATTFASTTIADIYGMMAKLPQYANANAKFFCSKACADMVFRRLAATSSGNTTMTLSNGINQTFLGYEIVTTQVLPTAQTSQAGVAYILFGDLDQTIVVGERRGITLATSKDRYFEYDQVAIKATQRWTAKASNDGDNTNAGGMVALVGHA